MAVLRRCLARAIARPGIKIDLVSDPRLGHIQLWHVWPRIQDVKKLCKVFV